MTIKPVAPLLAGMPERILLDWAELERIAGLPSGAARRTAVLERVRRLYPDASAELRADLAQADSEGVGFIRGLLGAA